MQSRRGEEERGREGISRNVQLGYTGRGINYINNTQEAGTTPRVDVPQGGTHRPGEKKKKRRVERKRIVPGLSTDL